MKLFKTFFPSLKIDFWPYLKLQKMDFNFFWPTVPKYWLLIKSVKNSQQYQIVYLPRIIIFSFPFSKLVCDATP